jgi:GT2 family glycosyltransferase
MPDPQISVVVVNYNTAHLLDEMFATLYRAAEGLHLQVIVIDNASRDDSVAVLRERHPEATLIVNDTNVGFGRANNQALPLIRAPLVLLLNTDAFVEPNTLRATLACMAANPRAGIVGVRLIGRDGVLQPSCRYFPTPWNLFLQRTGFSRFFPSVRLMDDMDWDHASLRECDWVPGCYYLIRKAVLDQVGLFDARFFLYYEEVDHCRMTKEAGWQVLYCPDTSVVHIGGESAKSVGQISGSGRQLSALQVESELLYFRKHHGLPGLVALLSLTLLAQAVIGVKGLLKWRPAELHGLGRELRLLMRLVGATRGGLQPTR